MKKLLAVFMTLVMLLSACAFAEETADFGGAEITLGNIAAFAGDAVLLDLTGIDLVLGVCEVGENVGIQIGLAANDQDVLSLNLAVAGEQLLLSMTGVSDVYSVDIASAAESVGVDVSTTLNVNEMTEEISPEDQAALMSLAVEAGAVIMAGVTPIGEQEIDGVVYEATEINVGAEAIQPLLEKAVAILDNYSYMLEDSGVESFTQLYTTLTPTLSLSGVILENEETGVVDVTATGTVLEGTESGLVNLYLEGATGEDESAEIYVEATVAAAEESYTLAFDLGFVNENDGSWMPTADAGTVDLISALEDETQSQVLMTQALSSAMMALSQMAAVNETVAALLSSMMSA